MQTSKTHIFNGIIDETVTAVLKIINFRNNLHADQTSWSISSHQSLTERCSRGHFIHTK